MHLTDHLTDEQLNEYLDEATNERPQIESHLSSCDECAARLTTLQTLFTEIESLPELALTKSLAAPFMRTSNLPAQLPRFLTLTVTLQRDADHYEPLKTLVTAKGAKTMAFDEKTKSIYLPTVVGESFVVLVATRH